VQEEIKLGQYSRSSSSPQIVNEEGLALASKGKDKQKKNKGGKKNIDFSKVKCFQCHMMGHFASQCLEKNKKNQPQMATSVVVDEFSKRFEGDLWFIACMSSTTISNMWFVDNRAYFHMTGHKEFFTRFQEGGMNLVIELGYDRRYKVQGVGTASFQQESDKPLWFVDVLYVSRLKKNLISDSTLEDKGYEVNFRNGRVFVMPTG
jgi:hypothetical protein